jgi:hypothetical protein
MKCPKQPELACPFYNIGASACLVAVCSGFHESHEPPPLGDARGIVPAQRDGHQNGQQNEYILHNRCFDCRPGGRRGDTEQVVARWWRSVASGEALVMLHLAMRSILHRCTAMAIKMTHGGGTFVRRHHLFRLL